MHRAHTGATETDSCARRQNATSLPRTIVTSLAPKENNKTFATTRRLAMASLWVAYARLASWRAHARDRELFSVSDLLLDCELIKCLFRRDAETDARDVCATQNCGLPNLARPHCRSYI
jgi:hypothetical protein